MKILNKFKGILVAVMALGIFLTLGTKNTYATESNIASGIYEVENDVYHESETGMAMSRTYLLPSMSVEVTKDHIIYTIGFSGSDYMENYRMKVNGGEVPVELVEENNEDGTVKLKVEVDKVDADMDALIYVGPMERDVEFKVIPKMETLTLIEAIEEVEEMPAEDEVVNENEEVQIEESLAVAADKEENNNNVALIIAGVVVIVAIGALVIVKAKKK
ncbi:MULTISPECIES: NEAT domain-containing protein [unclassified Clostridium]|uniref:NEAT domain-containing protein n=1 Tax=unclassified Clostridium TaxID=2614128 RepID=UPI00189AFCA9|nr:MULTISPECIES: NEAT domain-containing protein [unclassified Clostridium]MBP3914486.1 NEAT domain-containing protein [Clostridium sp.]MEE0933062.1 NEAT domain-containing protein [Clostridium sp.]